MTPKKIIATAHTAFSRKHNTLIHNVFTHISFWSILLTAITATALSTTAHAQTQGHKMMNEKEGFFTKQYEVMEADTTVMDGEYKLIYKNLVIESGLYSAGQRVGEWTFVNFEKMVELKYNYTLDQPTHILPHTGKVYNQTNYPSIYLGSPIVPYVFLMSNTFYPQSEANNKKGGRVVLTILLNSNGVMTGYKIKSASKPAFANAVKKAAERIPRDKFRWIPALKNGKNTSSEYDIVLLFGN